MQKPSPRILICPLDWGLGHASRCVPIIEELSNQGAEVIIAADKRPLHFLQMEFPDLETIRFGGFNIRYPVEGSMISKIAASLPHIINHIIEENKSLKKIIRENKIDAVISDNRFGLWSKQVPCVFITHQVKIKSPVFQKLINYFNRKTIRKYDLCWIPDIEGANNLSGDLCDRDNLPSNASFIGHLSRFKLEPIEEFPEKYDVTVIISGPEPQRSTFESMVIRELKTKALKAAVIRGVTEISDHYTINKNIEVFSHLETSALRKIILSSELIICRPGYSTVMDLAALNKKAIFVPTPGQTEQEYLGNYLTEKGMGIVIPQDKFNLESLFLKEIAAEPLPTNKNEILQEKVREFLSMVKN